MKARKTQESDMIEERKPVNVPMISKYFEDGQKTKKMTPNVPYTRNKYNNNVVYSATAEQLLTSTSTGPDPEMAVQSAAAGRPMATEGLKLSGHMTTEEPTGGEKQSLGQNMWERSNFV